ncbi:MAG: hypothetical protein A2Y02_02750 [Omnitrophica bacterium GWA2_52_12]|nr:MAG: hypothetical protein A2Y02_02750 [Omnitrophica bacterium GWA2_52_12]
MKNLGTLPRGWTGTGFAGSLRSNHEIFNVIAEAICDSLTCAVQETGESGVSVAEALKKVTYRVVDNRVWSGGNLSEGAKAVALAVLHAGSVMGTGSMEALGLAVEVFIRRTVELNGDVGAAACGLVQGAGEGARELGLSAEAVSSQAALNAVKAAYGMDLDSGDKVLDALAEFFSGMSVAL